jgi:hypothetical protein
MQQRGERYYIGIHKRSYCVFFSDLIMPFVVSIRSGALIPATADMPTRRMGNKRLKATRSDVINSGVRSWYCVNIPEGAMAAGCGWVLGISSCWRLS